MNLYTEGWCRMLLMFAPRSQTHATGLRWDSINPCMDRSPENSTSSLTLLRTESWQTTDVSSPRLDG